MRRKTLFIILLGILAVLVAACQQVPQESDNSAPQQAEIRGAGAGHMGCAVQEQGQTGCGLAEGENNVGLFGRDYEGIVSTQDVSTPELSGFLARPAAEGKYPGVVMVHEWWGLNGNIKEMAQLLASQGYLVFAIDLYGEVATTSERAGQLTGDVRNNQEAATEKLRAAASYIRGLPEFSGKLGSIGWCFGGGQSLQWALPGEPLDATVIYYGQLTDNQSRLSAIAWPVLGIFGAEDTSIPPSSVNAFKAALDNLGVQNDITIYPGVGHAFANPSGARYAANETRDAWGKTIAFFKKTLKG